jgi:hypothetical protein
VQTKEQGAQPHLWKKSVLAKTKCACITCIYVVQLWRDKKERNSSCFYWEKNVAAGLSEKEAYTTSSVKCEWELQAGRTAHRRL